MQLFDGLGLTLDATFTASRGSKQNPVMMLDPAGEPTSHARVSPRVEVFCPPPKTDRLGPMIDQLSQVGAAAWVPMSTSRAQGSASDFNREKLERVIVESAKQCGRAWLLEIGEPTSFDDAIQLDHTVLLDASGEPTLPKRADSVVRLLIGPEGGWTPQELDAARSAKVATLRAGPHILRVETAAVVAAANALQAE